MEVTFLLPWMRYYYCHGCDILIAMEVLYVLRCKWILIAMNVAFFLRWKSYSYCNACDILIAMNVTFLLAWMRYRYCHVRDILIAMNVTFLLPWIAKSHRDREVAYSTSDCQGPSFESCVWREVSSYSSHHPREVLLAHFSLYVHKGGLKPHSFHFQLVSSTRWDVPILKLHKSSF